MKKVEVNWCWACDSCGNTAEFSTLAEAKSFAKQISDYASYLHVGDMPKGVGVRYYPNKNCRFKGSIGDRRLADKLVSIFPELFE